MKTKNELNNVKTLKKTVLGCNQGGASGTHSHATRTRATWTLLVALTLVTFNNTKIIKAKCWLIKKIIMYCAPPFTASVRYYIQCYVKFFFTIPPFYMHILMLRRNIKLLFKQ